MTTMTSDNDGALTVNLTLTGAPSAPRVPIVIEKTTTPSQLREKAAQETKIPLEQIKIIFRGRLIANDNSKEAIAEYKLENDCVLHCMGKPVESVPATSTPASTPSAAAAGSSVSFLPPAAAPMNNNTSTSASGGGDSLQDALNTLRSTNSATDYLTAVTTLEKILSNCIEKPLEEKYRTVKRQNAAFQRRLGGLQGGHNAILACGFVVQGQGAEESYVLVASPEAWPKLLATKQKVSAAVMEAKSAAGTTSAPPAAASGGGFGGASLPPVGMPAGMGAGGVPPNMQNAMSNLMADPNALQAMLQNPSVQNMMQNDPRLNNPQMRQALDSLSSNPQMLNQVSSMMRDPAMQAQLQQMMQQGGGAMPGMSMPAGMMGGAPPSQAPNTNNESGASQPSNSNNNSGENDEEMTEEEMIAEAIRRSLGEN